MAPSTNASSSASTPASAPRSPKRRRLSSRTATVNKRPKLSREGSPSSSPDELAGDRWGDATSQTRNLTSNPSTRGLTRRVSKELASEVPRQRRSTEDDATPSNTHGSVSQGGAADDDSPDELGEPADVQPFFRASHSGPKTRGRESARKAPAKVRVERKSNRRSVMAEESPVQSPVASSTQSPLETSVEPHETIKKEDDEWTSTDQTAAPRNEDKSGEIARDNISQSTEQSREHSIDASAHDAMEVEDEAEAQLKQEERTRQRQKDAEWEQERERERAAERERARKARFRPYELSRSLRGHRKGISGVKFSPDGTRLASCCKCSYAGVSNLAVSRRGALSCLLSTLYSLAIGIGSRSCPTFFTKLTDRSRYSGRCYCSNMGRCYWQRSTRS